jgi:hypothetical protein
MKQTIKIGVIAVLETKPRKLTIGFTMEKSKENTRRQILGFSNKSPKNLKS